ncbi:uncharacterized protein LOC133463876 [Cololabis saira]|uniref:uncharacterized protein LOC133463876 n=1 Tax=Cololabis saira TaxID=129043 RepID=UPI002AD36C1A|nr:uncharacterized protein LOC133463876 [Cololabis saira]
MDLVEICSATSRGDNKRRVSKKNRSRRRRLHLRKTLAQPPAMQGPDKSGPRKIAEEWERAAAAWRPSKKPPQDARRSPGVTDDGGTTLRFPCPQCKDDSEYAPKDLTRHFVEKHRGSPPVFSCHRCNFSTTDFSHLQVHLLNHKDTFSTCSICNDNVQRSWSEFSAHLSTNHCPNGKYSCETCQKFSTGDVEVFLEHLFGHNLGLDEADGVDVSLLKKDNHSPSAQTFRCQYCDFEASRKFLITKHVNAVHVCKNGNRRKGNRGVHSAAGKPNEPIPRTKARLTRSAVKDMCWLAQDCLSLPGREFLDKYCHLSDPRTTLEETQQFLMKSVAGETHEQKWTNALKTVLSNVPKEMNLHGKLENGLMSSPSDLAVLRVKNKITVAQNGATYSKRLRMTSDKDVVSPESAVSAADAHGAVNHNGGTPELKDQPPCPDGDNNLLPEVPAPAQSEPKENRENQGLKTDQEAEERNKKLEGPVHAEGNHISGILTLAVESEEAAPARRALPRRKGQGWRRKRRGRFKKLVKTLEGETLKIVLKKNPVRGKRWVSRSSASPPGSDGTEGELNPLAAVEDPVQTLRNQRTVNVSTSDRIEAITPEPEREPALCCNVEAAEPEHATGTEPDAQPGSPSGKSPVPLVTDGDGSRLTAGPERTDQGEEEKQQEKQPLQESSAAADGRVTDDGTSGATSSPDPQTVLTPHDELEDSCLERPAVSIRTREEPPDSTCNLLQQNPPPLQQNSPPWTPVPKHQETTLKLTAIDPAQRVKRPAGDQPVVVLNHPDADIPQVTKIMQVVHRYREVRKVVLSRRTLVALGGPDGRPGPAEARRGPGGGSVQERFTLKMKLRRLSRKKYEIVEESVSRFPCWFCGRIFPGQENMLAHRQRHLAEWNRPAEWTRPRWENS